MFRRVVTAAIRGLINSCGFEVRRSDFRDSLVGALRQARGAGLTIQSVTDVGAAFGEFALRCHDVFPDAKYILVEPLEEYKPFLSRVLRTIPGAEHIQAACAKRGGEVLIHVHPDLVGSSLYLEQEDSDVNGLLRTISAVSLDDIMRGRNLEAPYLIKIDVQGAELDILEGGDEALKKTDYLLLEVSLFEFFKGGPQLHHVITFMKSRGFVVYDVLGPQYRPLDNALSQVDLVFVKETGLLRAHHYYASSKQREEQNKTFALQLRKRRKMLGRK